MAYTITLKHLEKVPLESKVNGVPAINGTVTLTHVGTRTGERVLGWKEKIERGETASSPYYLDMARTVRGRPERHTSVIQLDAAPRTIITSETVGHPGIQFQVSMPTHLLVSTSKARSMALSKLYKKLESDRSEMNAYASLAEITDVFRQFGTPFRSMVNVFERHQNRLYFERRRLVGTKTWKDEKFARIAAETWLEVSFGLIPLISDAESLAKALGRWEYELSDSPKLRDRMRTRALETTSTLTGPTAWASNQMTFRCLTKKTTEARAQYVAGLSGEVRADFGSNKRLLELLGLEGRNIPLAVWEAVPWSWLVDYGTNVQQILQAGATITSRVKWIVLTETFRTECFTNPKVEEVHNSAYKLLSFVSHYPKKIEDRGVRVIRTTLTRSLPSALGVPPLYFKSPIGNLKKMANLLAVAVSRSKDRTTWLS